MKSWILTAYLLLLGPGIPGYGPADSTALRFSVPPWVAVCLFAGPLVSLLNA